MPVGLSSKLIKLYKECVKYFIKKYQRKNRWKWRRKLVGDIKLWFKTVYGKFWRNKNVYPTGRKMVGHDTSKIKQTQKQKYKK